MSLKLNFFTKMLICCVLLLGISVFMTLQQMRTDQEAEAQMSAANSEEQQKTIKVFNVQTQAFEDLSRVSKSDEEWKKTLTSEEFHITRQAGTERPFTGKYWDNKKHGVYKCTNCGIDLFASNTKFKSGTGWPSFWEPVAKENVDTRTDNSLFMKRIEVVCKRCGAHLGHVFDDGPPPTNQRFCINSAALKFLEMEKK